MKRNLAALACVLIVVAVGARLGSRVSAPAVDWSEPVAVGGLELGMSYDEVKAVTGELPVAGRTAFMWEANFAAGEVLSIRLNRSSEAAAWRLVFARGTRLLQRNRPLLAVAAAEKDLESVLGPPDQVLDVPFNAVEDGTPCRRSVYRRVRCRRAHDGKNAGELRVDAANGAVIALNLWQ